MAAINLAIPDPTIEALRAQVAVRIATEQPRPYLGMSSIGEPCERRLFYSFRWAVPNDFTVDAWWRFEDGHRTEDVLAARLRLVPGITLNTVDQRTGQQFGFSDLGGHFRGHADGFIRGLVQAPVVLHVWEAKATNEKKFNELVKLRAVDEKAALAKWDPMYYAQAVMYMAYGDATRHYLTCATPGGRDIAGVRTNTNLGEARRLRQKAERIIGAAEPPTRISEDAAWFQCRFCPARETCHRNVLPLVNCRTCVHATPELDGDGRWSCALHKRDLSPGEQRAGCAGHRYIPALVTIAQAIDASEPENWVAYVMPDGRKFRNGARGVCSYSSEELRVMDPLAIGDTDADALRVAFDADHRAAA